MKGIYVKLPNNTWIMIRGKLGGITTGKTKKTGYTLIAEGIDKEPSINGKPNTRFYISSTKVAKYIYRLLDRDLGRNNCILIRYKNIETYVVEVYGPNAKKIYEIAEEMGIIRKYKAIK